MGQFILIIIAAIALWVGGATFFNEVWPGTYGDAPPAKERVVTCLPDSRVGCDYEPDGDYYPSTR